MDAVLRVTEVFKSIRETKFSGIRSPGEFFDYHRISRPADVNQAISRISYNTRYFSGNYGLIIAVLAVYAVITNYLLLISLAFLVFGFAAINKFAPEATQFGEHTITQKHLYTGLFVIGIPLLWISSPIGTFFWLVGASGVLILGHACILEPGVESEYATIQENV
ncbi:PRA1-like protein [Hypsizygus marmoreus]|uniref:PRA1 family protein n=1 Tax=Hypsizygus marmoreus TaxID=39966 RepID=A0A369JVN4_HYPMA|nr:PRA1-like protein [Hypsizygus marmoreus]